MQLSQEQIQVVKTIDKNLVVTAGAGAGKTAVLSKRFVNIMETRGAKIDEILTMTFTKKAASEMLERIRKEILEKTSPNSDGKIESNLKLEEISFENANIMTLDSFCSQITKGHLLKFGLPAVITPDEEEASAISTEVVLKWILKNDKEPILRKMIKIYGFESFWKDFLVPISVKAFRILNPISFKEQIKDQILSFPTKMEAIINELAQIYQFLAGEVTNFGRSKNLIAQYEYLTAFFRSYEEKYHLLEDYTERVKASLDGLVLPNKPSKSTNEKTQELIRSCSLAHDFILTIYDFIKMTDYKEDFYAFYSLLDSLQEEVLRERKSRGVVSFDDIAQISVALLTENKELRHFYKNKFKYIMVDEFQDNNELQKNLVYLLAEKLENEGDGIPQASELAPKLFFVGDEKQSIYRFRGADVSVFKGLGEELTQAGGEILSLSMNYRSEPGLIGGFNAFFERVFPEKGRGKTFEAEFEAIGSREAIASSSEFRFYYYDKKSEKMDLSPEEEENLVPKEIASLIECWVAEGKEVNDGKTTRPCQYKDFAILFRSTSAQHLYEKHLIKKAIPYDSQTVTSFYQEAIFNDFYNFFSLLVYPNDKTLYTSVLRSPFVRLDDEALLEHLLEDDMQLFATKKPLSSENLQKLEMARLLYSEILSLVDKISLATLVDKIWFEYGLRYEYLRNPKAQSFLNHFDYFRSLAMDIDLANKSCYDFIDLLREQSKSSFFGATAQLKDPRRFDFPENAVTLMTVHKSKGLQFPIVIVADAGRGKNPEKLGRFQFTKENQLYLQIPECDSIYSSTFNPLMKKEGNSLNAAEVDRLLYVAMTRAVNHLVVAGSISEGKKIDSFMERFTENGNSNAFNHVPMLNFVNIDLLEGIDAEADREVDDFADEEEAFSPKFYRLGAEVGTDYEKFSELALFGKETSVTALAKGDEEYDFTEFRRISSDASLKVFTDKLAKAGQANHFGTLCHDLLEWSETRGVANLPTKASPVFDFSEALQQLDPSLQETAKEFALQMVHNYLSSDDAIQLEEGCLMRTAEREFMMRSSDLEADFVTGRADLVLEYDDYALIIDFKSDSHEIPGRYDRQLEIYREAFAEILNLPIERVLTKLVYLQKYF